MKNKKIFPVIVCKTNKSEVNPIIFSISHRQNLNSKLMKTKTVSTEAKSLIINLVALSIGSLQDK